MPYDIALRKQAEKDCEHWEQHNPRYLAKIKALFEDMKVHPYEGLGHPEPLKHSLQGFWSRKISRYERILYDVKDNLIRIYKCRGHYE